jgi:hypothetical protein
MATMVVMINLDRRAPHNRTNEIAAVIPEHIWNQNGSWRFREDFFI